MNNAIRLAAVLALMAAPVAAQTNCAPHAAVVERLATGYGEYRQSIGLATDDTVVEMYASLETGTWSIVVTRHDGIACLVASGRGYEPTNELAPPPGEPL